jgi:putative selenate reductase
MQAAGAATLEQFACARGGGSDPIKAALAYLNTYADAVAEEKRYRWSAFPYEGIKTGRDLTVFDCIQAPCMTACPAGQDIPGYMSHTARGDDAAALATILATNPFPNLQGMVCDHLCQSRCTRLNYDNPLLIREIKRFVARRQPVTPPHEPAPANGLKVAVIGAGPSGLSCAYFLALNGFGVEIFEAGGRAGGMAAGVIPVFRLDQAGLQRDIDAILALGVKLHLSSTVDQGRFEQLRDTFDFVYVAVGAREGLRLGIPGEDAPGVYDQLEFLGAVRSGRAPDLGRKVIVVGGGNSALDAARTARRLVGPEGRVSIVYRRTRSEMPAEVGEIRAALAEGVELVELTAPECLLVENGRVTANVCFKMTLGEKDASGRPRPMKLEGSEFELEADSVIAAIGQRVVLDFIPGGELPVDAETLETRLPGVLAGGDAVRGAGTLIRAIGDGRRAAATICRKVDLEVDLPAPNRGPGVDLAQLKLARARRVYGTAAPETGPDHCRGFDLVTRTLDEADARREAGRCLRCDTLCHICITVCPNRANIAFETAPRNYPTYTARLDSGRVRIEKTGALCIRQPFQIINLGDFCNECGNCATFCPTCDGPYQVKPKFYLDARSLQGEARGYAFSRGALLARVAGRPERLRPRGGRLIYSTEAVEAHLKADDLTVEQVRHKAGAPSVVDLAHGTCLAVLWYGLKASPFSFGETA